MCKSVRRMVYLLLVLSGPVLVQAQVGTAFTYQGQLKQDGQPANGPHDFEFSLWDAAAGGSQVGPTVSLDDVPVADGLFTVQLDFGASPYATNEARWLQIVVNGTPLAPRQPLTPTAFSLATRGINVAENGNVGIGLPAQPRQRLWVVAPPGYEAAIRGESDSRGLLGLATGDGTGVAGYGSGGGVGVYGETQASTGVLGTARATSGLNYGVRGATNSPDGFAGYFEGRGYFSGNVGIGTTSPTSRLSVAGDASVTGFVSATNFAGSGGGLTNLDAGNIATGNLSIARMPTGGAWTITSNLNIDGDTLVVDRRNDKVGIGTAFPTVKLDVHTQGNESAVFGWAASGSGDLATGVEGWSDSTVGVGVIGWAWDGDMGVWGWSGASSGTRYGGYFESDSTSGRGAIGIAFSPTGTNFGVVGRSESTSGRGVRGIANATSGTNYGIWGESNSPSGWGVWAQGRLGASGTKSFRIDHPLDPANKYLLHYSSEGPQPLNVYSGNVTTDSDGYAVVVLPAYFEAINRDYRYQLTVIDDDNHDSFVLVKVVEKIRDNRFVIRTSAPAVEVSWRVEGVRDDAYVRSLGAPEEQEKGASERGKYLHPELYGQSVDRGVSFTPEVDDLRPTQKREKVRDRLGSRRIPVLPTPDGSSELP